MIDSSKMKQVLLKKQEELQKRITNTQAAEQHEAKEVRPDSAKLWEASEIRGDLDDEAAAELKQVNEALARLDAGQFGTCASCGGEISDERLEALPHAPLCIACASRAEPQC